MRLQRLQRLGIFTRHGAVLAQDRPHDGAAAAEQSQVVAKSAVGQAGFEISASEAKVNFPQPLARQRAVLGKLRRV